MAEKPHQAYEGMFLFPQAATSNLGEVVDHLNSIFDRAKAEVIAMKKWDERKLAYEIGKHRRGLYILTYFSAPGESMAQLERDANLSDHILRFMVIRADHLTDEEMRSQDERQALADEAAMRREEAASQESGPADEGGEPVAAAESSSSAASEESE
jgi:small subunit ribosomal protein S6